ncbi:MAG: hypothetical protein ACE37J_04410 [Pikeienuella sp.]|uniref:hypothetical protein n=1 Tax=Pikeienuella sp. TaxID=2831957 RepID=UPI00391D3D1E
MNLTRLLRGACAGAALAGASALSSQAASFDFSAVLPAFESLPEATIEGTLSFDDSAFIENLASPGAGFIPGSAVSISFVLSGRTFTEADADASLELEVEDFGGPGAPLFSILDFNYEFDGDALSTFAFAFGGEPDIDDAGDLVFEGEFFTFMGGNTTPGSPGPGNPDGVIPLPATLPLLLGALGVGGLLLRRRPA